MWGPVITEEEANSVFEEPPNLELFTQDQACSLLISISFLLDHPGTVGTFLKSKTRAKCTSKTYLNKLLKIKLKKYKDHNNHLGVICDKQSMVTTELKLLGIEIKYITL